MMYRPYISGRLQEARINKVCGGYQTEFEFPNGYGASVVMHNMSYGGMRDCFELAVTKFNKKTKAWDLDYTSGLTTDVLGYLSDGEVDEILVKIAALPMDLTMI